MIALDNGTFVMVFPSVGNTSGKSGVGIAAASNPAGPFVDQLGGPLMQGDDPTIFVDRKTGLTHLCSNAFGGPYCGVLNPDLKSWRVPPEVLPEFAGASQRNWHW